MELRKHQAAMLDIARRIVAGEEIKTIFASVTPGGGKSALPALLADTLIPSYFDAIVWVVPRNSLRTQGEGDYLQWASKTRIRASDNDGDPLRGYSGYVTTYQAIVANPDLHLRALKWKRFILFLDEPHHIMEGSSWDDAIVPLVKAAGLVVYASGTFARGDGQPIAGLAYGPDGLPVLDGSGHSALIRYSRTDALKENAICPVHFRYIDGRTEWEEDGEHRSAGSLSCGEYASQALFTALRTEYALQLLDEAMADWRTHRETENHEAKFLVVSPDIKLAEIYQAHLHRRRIDSLIATSADDRAAQEAILRFKGHLSPRVDVLVTCQIAYEGLSVPQISHVACLTHIRSIQWLEQCFARANRLAPGKTRGIIYGPNDPRFREAIVSIEAEQALALKEQEDRSEDQEDGEGGGGGQRQRIQPLRSEAIGLEPGLFDSTPAPKKDGGLPPSQAEKLLRSQIATHIEIVVGRRRPGARAGLERVIIAGLKDLMGGRGRKELTVDELARQWSWLKERYPL